MNRTDLDTAVTRVSKYLEGGCRLLRKSGTLIPQIRGFTADGRGITFSFDTSDPDQVQETLNLARALLCLNNCESYLIISEEETGLRFTGNNPDVPSSLTNKIHQVNAVMAFYVCDSGVLWGFRQFQCDAHGQITEFCPPNIMDQFDDTTMHSWLTSLLDRSLITDEYRSLAMRAMELSSFQVSAAVH